MFLKELVDSHLANVYQCVTSRPDVDMVSILEPRTASLHGAGGQKRIIKNYIDSVADTDRKMQNWSSAQRQLVIDVLTEIADVM